MSNSIPSGLSTTGSRAMLAGLILGALVVSSLSAAPLQLPAWPQRFDITGPESVSFGFIVTQPGPVIVDIQTNGTPIVASLQSAQPPAAEQSGSGSLHLAYQVTARDIQTNPMWTIKMKLAQPMSAESAGHAAGNVAVHAPAVDPGVAQALLDKGIAQQQSAKQAAAQRPAQADPAVTAQMDAVLNGRRAQFEQQRQQVRAQMHAQLQPQAAAAQARLANRVGTRGLAPASTAMMSAAPPTELRAARVATVSATASSSQALTAAGSGPGPQTVMPNPVINSLSAVRGQPGDPVLINGSGFANGGEVHFVINPGKDVVAHVDIWSDTQIFAEVPDASGILGFNGQTYVVRTDLARSNIVPFQFNPGTEFRDLRSTLDRVLQYPYIASSTTANQVDRDNANPFSGFQGNDMLFLTTRLKNGWVVDDAFVYCLYNLYGMNFCSGGAYPAAVSRGSPSPSLTVHWWIDPGPFGNYSNLAYQFDVRIVGPKGVPDGVAVP
jgi:hypothetical protein